MTTSTMSIRVWKVLLLLLLFAAASLIGEAVRQSPDLLGPDVTGSLRVETSPERVFGSQRRVVDSLQVDSPLRMAGAKVGDLIEFDHFYDARGSAVPGKPVALTLYQNGVAKALTVLTIAERRPPDRAFAVLNLVYFCAGLLFAALVGFKRADSIACRALSLFFVGTVFIGVFWIAAPGMNAIVANLTNSLFDMVWGALAVFAIYYPDDKPTRLRAHLARLLPWLAVAVLLLVSIRLVSRAGYFVSNERFSGIAFCGLNLAIILMSLWDGWRWSKGEARQRQLWLLAALGPFAVLAETAVLVGAALPDFYHDYHYLIRSWALFAYVGLAYAVLRYRVFNFGFAVNRALVFTIISTLLLILFAIVEFAVDKLLHFHGRQTNIIVDALVALGVILSFHRIQHWIGHRVDRTFFQNWYEAARRLRHFTATSVYINDAPALLTRFAIEIDEFTAGSGTAIYGAAANGAFALRHSSLASAPTMLGPNDLLILDLRHAHAALEPGRAQLAYGAALVLPMLARGAITGIVLIGPRKDEHTLRPDQVELSREAVHNLGQNLESLRVEELENERGALVQGRALLVHEAAVLRDVLTAAAKVPVPA